MDLLPLRRQIENRLKQFAETKNIILSLKWKREQNNEEHGSVTSWKTNRKWNGSNSLEETKWFVNKEKQKDIKNYHWNERENKLIPTSNKLLKRNCNFWNEHSMDIFHKHIPLYTHTAPLSNLIY